jgi:hypothetical protein
MSRPERHKLIPGDRVRAKVRTMCGWKNTGTVVRVWDDDILIEKDGAPAGSLAEFCPHELTRLRGEH